MMLQPQGRTVMIMVWTLAVLLLHGVLGVKRTIIQVKIAFEPATMSLV